jgi:hypothetical protein
MIIGIDNGLDGGLCAISAYSGDLIERIAMPTFQRAGKREVDAMSIYKWFVKMHTPATIVIEEPLKHAKSSQAMRSMGISFGKVMGMCEAYGLNIQPIEVRDWQTVMLGKVPKGQTKKFALTAAKKFLPDEKWLATKRSTTPHDGLVDAFLIAQYYRLHKQES